MTLTELNKLSEGAMLKHNYWGIVKLEKVVYIKNEFFGVVIELYEPEKIKEFNETFQKRWVKPLATMTVLDLKSLSLCD